MAEFGAEVRGITGGRAERLAIVGGRDEGMLMYAGGRKFARLDDALRGWSAGSVDWLVLGKGDFERVARTLGGFEILLDAEKTPGKQDGYVLVGRPGNAARSTGEGERTGR